MRLQALHVTGEEQRIEADKGAQKLHIEPLFSGGAFGNDYNDDRLMHMKSPAGMQRALLYATITGRSSGLLVMESILHGPGDYSRIADSARLGRL